MVARRVDNRRPGRRSASTPEGRENQLIADAMDLAERQIREGTASAQVITHFLKLASPREELERNRLRHEVELLNAKVEQLASSQRVEELYSNAIVAMRRYQGQEVDDERYYDEG